MIVLRRVWLFVLVAAAFMVVVPSAFALEVSEEGGDHCGPITEPVTHTPHTDGVGGTGGGGVGGCTLEAAGEDIELGNGPIMIFCDNHFEARIDEDGNGYIYNQSITNCSAPFAGTRACEEVDDQGQGVWPVNLPAGDLLELNFCLEFLLNGQHLADARCHLEFDIVENNHLYEFTTGGVHRACEDEGSTFSLDGHWLQDLTHGHTEVLEIIN